MNDTEILNKILQIVPKTKFEVFENKVKKISFFEKTNIFGGIIRHYSKTEKRKIIKLINMLENLEVLDLTKNRIGNLLNEIKLTKLKEVYISSNYTQCLPDFIYKNKNLEIINLGANEITDSIDLEELNNLKVFKIHKNKIKNIYLNSPNLIFLNLYLCPIKLVPEWVFKLKELKYLSIGGCPISQFEFKNKKIEFISIVATKIKQIPENINELKNLKGIRLIKSKLEKIPESIGYLEKLEEISFYDNLIKELPESFRFLKLKKLNLAKNNIENLNIINLKNMQWNLF